MLLRILGVVGGKNMPCWIAVLLGVRAPILSEVNQMLRHTPARRDKRAKRSKS